MSVVVTAVYEKGLLRPLRPLPLIENQTVTIEVHAGTDENSLIHQLIASNILTPPKGVTEPPISLEDRLALADRIAQVATRPLSEVIIEERFEL